jgi:acetyltransferase-like isoleucine patch superfamily enzyme
VLGDGDRIGEGVLSRADVVAHDGTQIGHRRAMDHAAVLGKSPRLAPCVDHVARRAAPMRIGARVTVCAGAVLYGGSEIADQAIVGTWRKSEELTTIASGP